MGRHMTISPMTENQRLLTLADRLRDARRAKGLSQTVLAQRSGVGQNTISDLETGKSQGSTQLVQIAEQLEVRAAWLATGRGARLPGPALSVVSRPSPFGLGSATFARSMPPGALIPVMGVVRFPDSEGFADMQSSAGNVVCYIDLPTADPAAYAVQCQGDSMAPRIKHNEYIVAEPSVEVSPGDEVLVRSTEGRMMVKQFLYARDGRLHFASVNDPTASVVLDANEVESLHFVSAIAKSHRVVTK